MTELELLTGMSFFRGLSDDEVRMLDRVCHPAGV